MFLVKRLFQKFIWPPMMQPTHQVHVIPRRGNAWVVGTVNQDHAEKTAEEYRRYGYRTRIEDLTQD